MSSSSISALGSSASSQFTCNICKVTFENNTLQRTHAKSEWHIYNLKRHLTSLPPIPSKVYYDRVANIQETSTADASESLAFHESCTTCKKDCYSPKAFYNHLKSTSHVQAIARLDSKDESSGNDPSPNDIEDPVPQIEKLSSSSSCLFCPSSFSALEHNMAHLHTTHTFTIPHQNSLIDLATFINYLSTLITTFHECLYCGQTRDTASAIQQHMLDKGHCCLADDAADSSEFEDFYEFEEGDSEEEDEKGGDEVRSSNYPIQTDTGELRLPSGRTLGHRSKARYFRQNHTSAKHPNQKTIKGGINEVGPSNQTDRRAAMSLMQSGNANKGLVGLPELEQRAVRAREKKMLKMEVRARNLYQARVEKGGNKQKFFKPDVPGPKNG